MAIGGETADEMTGDWGAESKSEPDWDGEAEGGKFSEGKFSAGEREKFIQRREENEEIKEQEKKKKMNYLIWDENMRRKKTRKKRNKIIIKFIRIEQREDAINREFQSRKYVDASAKTLRRIFPR